MRERGERIVTHPDRRLRAARIGVNDRADLMRAEAVAQMRILEAHARTGVTFLQPETTRVEAGVAIGEDTVVAPGVSLRGRDRGGRRVPSSARTPPSIDSRGRRRGPGAALLLVERRRGRRAPAWAPSPTCARAPSCGEGAKVGTFVEVKNSDVGAGAKVPHLSYIGDADVGEGSNLGAEHDHRQLRRPQEAPHDASERA